MRLPRVSATYTDPSLPTATARGEVNCPSPTPSAPHILSAVNTCLLFTYGSSGAGASEADPTPSDHNCAATSLRMYSLMRSDTGQRDKL